MNAALIQFTPARLSVARVSIVKVRNAGSAASPGTGVPGSSWLLAGTISGSTRSSVPVTTNVVGNPVAATVAVSRFTWFVATSIIENDCNVQVPVSA